MPCYFSQCGDHCYGVCRPGRGRAADTAGLRQDAQRRQQQAVAAELAVLRQQMQQLNTKLGQLQGKLAERETQLNALREYRSDLRWLVRAAVQHWRRNRKSYEAYGQQLPQGWDHEADECLDYAMEDLARATAAPQAPRG